MDGARRLPAAADAGRGFDALEVSVRAALERYSNVHRGTGHNSIITTALYEVARRIVLEHFGLDNRTHTVVFCSPRRLGLLLERVDRPEEVKVVSSREIGLPLGLRAAAVRRAALRRGRPFETGGGTIRMVSRFNVAWAPVPERLEPGTPNIVGVIALARALQLRKTLGPDAFVPRDDATPVSELFEPTGLDGLTGVQAHDRLRELLVGRGLEVPVDDGDTAYVNFDNGATTPTFEPIWETACRVWRLGPERESGVVDAVRGICAELFGAPADEYDVVFAANTTEAINIAMQGFTAGCRADEQAVVLNTMLEHNSNELPWRFCPRAELRRLGVDAEGFMDLEQLEAELRAFNRDGRHGRKRIRLVAVCGASNVVGTANDLGRICRLAHEHDARVLVDAAQLSAHRQIRMREWDVDFLAFSGHKIYAPFGSGGVVARRRLFDRSAPGMDAAVSSGEENAVGIGALGAALRLLEEVGFDAIVEEERKLTAATLAGLEARSRYRVFGVTDRDSERFRQRGGVVCFESQRLPHNLLAKRLGEDGGIGVRNGCFCANMYVKSLLGVSLAMDTFGHVGLALFPRLMEKLLVGLVRVSFGIENNLEEVERLLLTLDRVGQIPVSRLNRLLARMHLGTPAVGRTATERRIDELVNRWVEKVYSPDAVRFVSHTARDAGHAAHG